MLKIGGRNVGRTGFGLMGLTRPESPLPRKDCFAALNKSLECGANYWNGGEFYGTTEHNSLHLLRDYFTRYPENAQKVALCIKGGRKPEGRDFKFEFDGTRKGVGRSIEECLRVLDGKASVDIFECARVDPRTPIEETVEVLAEYVHCGKIGGIGLSEVRAETIRRAHKVHEIAQVEVELSLWASDPLRNGIVSTCAELGIPLIAYSPLSRGGLTQTIDRTAEKLPEHLQILPRFQGASFSHNMRLTDQVARIANQRSCSLPQVALSWLRSLSETSGRGVIIPIPGAEREDWIVENCSHVTLSDSELEDLRSIIDNFQIEGQRYGGYVEERCDG